MCVCAYPMYLSIIKLRELHSYDLIFQGTTYTIKVLVQY
jgi:hypothetical protein